MNKLIQLKQFLRSVIMRRMGTDVIIPDGFEQAAEALGVLPPAGELPSPSRLENTTPLPTYSSAAEQVREFMKLNHIVQKTVVLPPSQAWVGEVFLQTDKPLLGITYMYEETL